MGVSLQRFLRGKLRVSEKIVFNPRRKDCPPWTQMLATTVDFLKESGEVLLIMTGPPLRCHPCRLPANANHFPRKSHSLRRIYVRGSSPFLLGYERHPNYLDRAFENTCAEVKNKNLVCAKNQEIHADNSKTGIRYVKKSRKHMRITQKS